jgi:WD40 repeat protein
MAVLVSKDNTLTGHADCIYTIKGGSEKEIFFSAAGDGMVAKWNLSDPENGELIAKLPSSVYAIQHISGDNVLVIGQNFEGIHLVDVENKKEVANLKLSDAAIFDIQYFEGRLFIGDGAGSVFIVQYPDLKIIKKIKGSSKSARAIDINSINRELAIGFSDNFIRIYDLDTFSLKYEVEAHKISVFTIKFTKDGRFLISGSRDAHLKIWDVNKGYELHESIVAHMYAINDLVFSPDYKYFATCSMDKSIKIWDAEKLKLLKVIDKARYAGHGTSVNKLYWTNYQNKLVSCSDDRTISIWNINFETE